MAVLEVRNLVKNFDRTEVLKKIDFSLEKGEVLAIIGSSGSGKTTLLRCLNFLETPDAGQIAVNGETLFDGNDPVTQNEETVRKKRLHFGLVFQSFNLFPQYTALKNVMLAPQLQVDKKPIGQSKAVPRNCFDRSDCGKRRIFIRASFPADSSSVWRLPARWH